MVGEANLLQNCRSPVGTHYASKVHFAARPLAGIRTRKCPECRPGMGAATFPLSDDIVAFRDQVGSVPEIQVRECRTEIGHEGLDVISAATRLMERIFRQHLRRGDFVNEAQDCRSCPRLDACNSLSCRSTVGGSGCDFVN